jgi:hypothetical protein
VVAVVIGIAVFSSCGEKKPLPTEPTLPPPDSSATFTRVQNEVFTVSCAIAGCHAALGAREGMNLSAGAAYANTVLVPATERPSLNRIEPGDPDQSYLVKKLRGDPNITGLRMPDGGTLTPDEIQLVIDWVRRGAPQD